MYSSLLEKRPWLKYYDWKTPWTINYPKIPVYQMLRSAVGQHPNKTATWFYGTEITFLELYRLVTRLANGLVDLGIKKGDRVGIMLPNCPQFVITYWATLMAGGIVVNLSPMYTYDELMHTVKITEIKGLFTFDALIPLITPVCKQIDIPNVAVTRITDFVKGAPVSTKAELGLPENWYHFSELLDKCENIIPPRVPIESDDPAVIQFTGGTTGVPKGATLTNFNLIAAAYSSVYWTQVRLENVPFEKRRLMCTLPYFHVYGQVCCLLYATLSLSTQVLLPKFEVEEVFNTLNQFETFHYWPLVPTMFTAVLFHPRAAEIDWRIKVDHYVLGAAPSPLHMLERAASLDANATEGWGMSETTSLGFCNPYNRAKHLSIGVAFPDTDLRLVNPDTLEDVEQGQPGELLIKSPLVMKGYWNNPEETAKAFTEDGWLRTGDVAYMDEEGYIFIVDRTKDMVIAGGYNIYPKEIDDILFRHPKVKDAITVGIPDEYRGETVKVFVQLVEGVECTAEELIAYCREHLAAYKVPRQIEFRKELPRTAVGKALRRLLRDEELAKSQAAGTSETNPE